MSSYYSLIFLALVSAVPRVAFSHEQTNEKSSKPVVDKNDHDFSNESDIINKRLFVQLFVKSRKEHLEIVKNIRQLGNYEKQYKMISILAENSLNIVETSRAAIEGGKFLPEDNAALKNITIRHALTAILENCALFGDAVLQLPDITQRVIKSNKSWNETIHWGLKFVNEARNFLDKPTITMFDLVRQELRITTRDPTYANPYWSRNNKDTKNEKDARKSMRVSKKSKKPKGPQMVNIEL